MYRWNTDISIQEGRMCIHDQLFLLSGSFHFLLHSGLTYTVRHISTLPSLQLHFGHRNCKFCLKDLFDFTCGSHLCKGNEFSKLKKKKKKNLCEQVQLLSEEHLPTVLASSTTSSTVRCLYSTLKLSMRD